MAWETKGRSRYYTRSKRVGRRVVREYLGMGPEAHLAAALDERRRQDREAARAARRCQRERWEAAARPLNELADLVELFVRATLFAAGFHRHQRSWRRRRHGRD
jgi:hypothetical protein